MLSAVVEEERGDEEKGIGSIFLTLVKAVYQPTECGIWYLEKPIDDLPTHIVLVRREEAGIE